MKHLKRKLAASLAAATMAIGVVAAPAMTASAQSFTSITQKTALVTMNQYSTFINWGTSTLPHGRYWNSGNPNTTTNSPCSPTHHCTYVYGNTVRSLGYTTQISGPNDGYYQCAGYARHLANKYFGSHNFIRDTRVADYYVPRMGDQLRVGPAAYNNNAAHSIFITNWNSSTNTITFTDCNWYGDCRIRWNQTATINNTNHTITFSNGTVKTLYYADRPMMAGDINGDLNVDHADGVASAYLAAGGLNNYSVSARPYVKAAGDVNGDGQLNAADHSLIESQYVYTPYVSYLNNDYGRFVDYI